MDFCNRYLTDYVRNPLIHTLTWSSDEATFNLDGLLNRHNDVLWSQANPNRTIEKRQKSVSLSVWCALSSFGVIGPYFFHADPGTDRNGRQIFGPNFNPCTVNSTNYLKMLKDFVIPALKRYPDFEDFYFIQDGAPAHFGNQVRAYLNQELGSRWIGRGVTQNGSIPWPPRSPDLTACDFFLWGYLKNEVYKTFPATLPELQFRIIEAFQNLPWMMVVNACESVPRRLATCLRLNGMQVLRSDK